MNLTRRIRKPDKSLSRYFLTKTEKVKKGEAKYLVLMANFRDPGSEKSGRFRSEHLKTLGRIDDLKPDELVHMATSFADNINAELVRRRAPKRILAQIITPQDIFSDPEKEGGAPDVHP